jgi:hypothetical protein
MFEPGVNAAPATRTGQATRNGINERGRAWAALTPRNIALKRGGKVTGEAIRWFDRVDQYIL